MPRIPRSSLFVLLLAVPACGNGGGDTTSSTAGTGGGSGGSSSTGSVVDSGSGGGTSTSSVGTGTGGASSTSATGTGGASSTSSTGTTGTGGGSSTSTTSTTGTGGVMGCNLVPCPPPDSCHDAPVCDLATGACSNPPKADGAACDAGGDCAVVATCQAGVCTGSPLSGFGAGATIWTTEVTGPLVGVMYPENTANFELTSVTSGSGGRVFFGVRYAVPIVEHPPYGLAAYAVDGPGGVQVLASHTNFSAQQFLGDYLLNVSLQVFGAQHYVIDYDFEGGDQSPTAHVDSDDGTFSSYLGYTLHGLQGTGDAAGDLLVAGANGMDLRRIDATGTTVYTRSLPALPQVLKAGPLGDAYLASALEGTMDFGCGALSGGPFYAARLDPGGGCLWSRTLPAWASLLTGGAHDYLTGTFNGTLDLGCGAMTGGTGVSFLAALDGAGACLWSKSFAGLGWSLLPSGDPLLQGAFSGTVDVGCGPVTSGSGGSYLVARFDATGACLWDRSFAVPAADVAVSASGVLAVGVNFAGTIDLGTGPLTSAGAQDMGVAELDATTGATLWSEHFGGTGAGVGVGLYGVFAVDDGGGVLAAGAVGGTADLGGGPVTDSNFTLRLDGSGAFRWQRALTGTLVYDACGATTLVTMAETNDGASELKSAVVTLERIAP